jgi:two-component system sensor histidine kinase TctE
VLQSQQRASRLVDQLLALALADEAGAAIQLHRLDLAACARDRLVRLLPQADEAGFELEATGLEAPVWVMGDAALIDGLLANLLDNALRYGRRPGRPGRIRLEVVEAAGRVQLVIEDEGPGIDAGQRESLKLRWRQGRDGQRLGVGSGLGLAIVQRYAELMGASVSLETGIGGQGLRIRVSFPSPQDTTLPPP